MPEMPSVRLPKWIEVRINTITTERELRRLLRTEYVGGGCASQLEEVGRA